MCMMIGGTANHHIYRNTVYINTCTMVLAVNLGVVAGVGVAGDYFIIRYFFFFFCDTLFLRGWCTKMLTSRVGRDL